MKLIESYKFLKQANKLTKNNSLLSNRLEKILEKLSSNPFDSSLSTHKLKGKLSDLYSASVTGNIRIIFKFVKEDNELCILLITIGKHEEVY